MGTILITLADPDDVYHGHDPELGKDIDLGNGQIAEITAEHLERLSEDWPKRFRKLTKAQAEEHATALAAQRAIDAEAQTAAGLEPTTTEPPAPPVDPNAPPAPPIDPNAPPIDPDGTPGGGTDADGAGTGQTDATSGSDGQ